MHIDRQGQKGSGRLSVSELVGNMRPELLITVHVGTQYEEWLLSASGRIINMARF